MNPFDDDDGTFVVVVNEEGQHALWPAFLAVPDGWSVTHGADTRQACLQYVESAWGDMRPRSLVEAMEPDSVHLSPPNGVTDVTGDSAVAESRADSRWIPGGPAVEDTSAQRNQLSRRRAGTTRRSPS